VAALERLDAGTFGRCVECGMEIPAERLDDLPYTPYCVVCEAAHEAE
jgi:RNA polymerase-binding transcription factor DksA